MAAILPIRYNGRIMNLFARCSRGTFAVLSILFLTIPAAVLSAGEPTLGATTERIAPPGHPPAGLPFEVYRPAGKEGEESDSSVAAAVERIDTDSLHSIVGRLEAFGTRYEFSTQQESAAVYIAGRLEALGYEPDFHPFELSTWRLNGLSFVDSANGRFVARSGGDLDSAIIAVTTDGGGSWTAEMTAPTALYGIVGISPNLAWAVGNGGAVYRHDENGWTALEPFSEQKLVSVDFSDSLHGMIAGRNATIYSTDDGGASWDTTALLGGLLNDVRLLDGGAAWCCGTSGRIWRYSAGEWMLQETPTFSTVYELDFSDTTFGCAAFSDSALLVWDGSSWDRVRAPLRFGYATDIVGDSTVWLGGPDAVGVNHVFRSFDRGLSFEEAPLPLGVLFATPLAIHAGDGGEVLLAGTEGFLMGSGDGGDTWTKGVLPGPMVHPSRNVYADHYGVTKPGEMVILSGHYDSIVHSGGDPMIVAPGADDDGTGAAAVLEAARVLADLSTERTIRFVFFSGEELGLLGSAAYAMEEREKGRKIVADVQVDMIGIPDDGPLRLIADENSISILDEAAPLRELYAPDLHWSLLISPAETFSDHASFWANGYEAIMVGETFDFRTHPLHTPGDTLGNIDFDFALSSTRLVTALAATLARPAADDEPQAPATSTLDPPFPNPGSSRFTIPVSGAPGGVTVTIYNAAGREVRRITTLHGGGDTAWVEWDGLDAGGDQARAGVYFARIDEGGAKVSRKLVLVR